MKESSVIQLLLRLWHHLKAERRIQFGCLLLLMVFASFAEMVSIGAILPFLGALTEPDKVFLYPDAQVVIKGLGIKSQEELLLPLTVLFALSALVAGGVRLLLAWSNNQLAFATGADLSIGIYRRTLYQPYSIHVMRNSSEVINGIVIKVSSVIYGTIGPILVLISSGLMLIAVLAVLISIDPIISVGAFAGFGLIYSLVIWGTRSAKLNNGILIAHESTQVIKSLQEGLGGIRDVLIDGSQEIYCQTYGDADQRLRKAQAGNQFVSQAPRYGVEALGMVLIGALAYVLAKQPGGVGNAVPILGGLALGAQRLLPIMQQAYASWSSLEGGKKILEDTLTLLDQPLPNYDANASTPEFLFEHAVELNNVSYRYSDDAPWVIKDLSLTIPKGSRIGFIGNTGCGKSTLLDILMGLLQPAEGSIQIDGRPITIGNTRKWQAHIAHVPQTIYLSDATVEANIAFGQPKELIDTARLVEAAKQAQIHDVIEGLPKKYETFVGERGVRLSGGQRQRIGIARALYRKADVIVFDEATSALDSETEKAVMEAIENLGKDLTVLIIAHRLSTLKNCTQIVEIADGRLQRLGSYKEIVN